MTDYYFDLVVCLESGNDMLRTRENIKDTVRATVDGVINTYDITRPEESKLHARIRFVAFGGGYDKITETDFVDVFTQWDSVENFLDTIDYSGLTGNPMMALERAIYSDWTEVDVPHRRQAILFLCRGDMANCHALTADIEARMGKLRPIWRGDAKAEGCKLNPKKARLITVADGNYPWFSTFDWERYFYCCSIPGENSEEVRALTEWVFGFGL